MILARFSLAWVLLLPLVGRAGVDFNRDIRPILAGNCLKCHGMDEQARKANLRLDVRTSAIGAAKSGDHAIVPGQPRQSALIRRVFSDAPDEHMPPPATKLVLSDAQKNLLRQWVSEGAAYQPHWAFVAPRQSPPPAANADKSGWCRNAIDRFVIARLDREGLEPSAEADKLTLVRRVYLDLIGLPPTPAETDAFAADPSPDAYGKLVDHLLASPRYGERWARRWLDLARYSDTNGYEKDRARSIWPFRDWVIRALNDDMPFDEFTIEQLAGDMLPHATIEQKIATGFHRNSMLNEEGGIDPLEYRFYSSVDRLATTGTTWLGLTIACAQCHTHKYDPISHREYYQLLALLNNADEPTLDIPNDQTATKRKAAEQKIAELTARLPGEFPGGQEAMNQSLERWQQGESARAVKWTVLRPSGMKSSMPILTLQPDDSILAGGDITKSDTYDLTFKLETKGIIALRLEALPDNSLPRHGPGMIFYEGPIGDFCLSEIALQSGGETVKFAKAAHSYASGKFTAAAAIDGNPQTGWMIDGAQGQAHQAVFSLEKPLGEESSLTVHMLFERHFAPALGHFRISVTSDPREMEPHAMPPDVETALVTPAELRTEAQRETIQRRFLEVAPELAGARKEIESLRKNLPEPPTTLVMVERPAGHPRPTRVHHRGEYLNTEEEVSGGVPAFLPPMPTGAPRDRLAFARWIASGENPLTARVAVNRQWQALFGRGFVATLGDFGYQGDSPTHPELLDWLAVEFEKPATEGGMAWSMKRLHRLIVTSATYRQSSRGTPALWARDPQNLLLARGPRFRAEAEIIRDSALAESGLLTDKIGGPSVYPPQPPSVTTEGAYGPLTWTASTGPDRYRRSLYTFSKRSAPFAMYIAFDGPSGETCASRRDVSNSPLQALTLLNDQIFTESAQALGRTIAGLKDATDQQRATEVFRRCLTRAPQKDEVADLVDFAQRQRERLTAHELDAGKIAGADKGDETDRAVWTTVARAVLNLDEAMTKN